MYWGKIIGGLLAIFLILIVVIMTIVHSRAEQEIQNQILSSSPPIQDKYSYIGSDLELVLKKTKNNMNILNSLESKSLANPDEKGDILKMQTTYESSQNQLDLLEKFQLKIIMELNELMAEKQIDTDIQNAIRATKSISWENTFNTAILKQMKHLELPSEDKEIIKTHAKNIHKITTDIAIVQRFLTVFPTTQDRFCTSDDIESDPFVRWTFTYIHNETKMVDRCMDKSTKVQQHVCTGSKEATQSPTITDCQYGCFKGTCRRGNISKITVSDDPIVNKGDFRISLVTNSLHNTDIGTTFLIQSPSLKNDACSIWTSQGPILDGDEMVTTIGPLRCQEGQHVFQVFLKHGEQFTDSKSITIDVIEATESMGQDET